MTLLVRHPATPPGAIHTVDAELVRTAHGVIATFRAIGDIARLVLPAAAAPERADELWTTTCFELFVGGEGEAYREFNFSPSTRWAAYGFAGYRDHSGNVPARIEVEFARDSKHVVLIAKIDCDIPNPARIGLSAVIEETDGAIRYWAVAFAPGKPDFHAEATRALLLDGVDAQ
jgi:hypothetical protein